MRRRERPIKSMPSQCRMCECHSGGLPAARRPWRCRLRARRRLQAAVRWSAGLRESPCQPSPAGPCTGRITGCRVERATEPEWHLQASPGAAVACHSRDPAPGIARVGRPIGPAERLFPGSRPPVGSRRPGRGSAAPASRWGGRRAAHKGVASGRIGYRRTPTRRGRARACRQLRRTQDSSPPRRPDAGAASRLAVIAPAAALHLLPAGSRAGA